MNPSHAIPSFRMAVGAGSLASLGGTDAARSRVDDGKRTEAGDSSGCQGWPAARRLSFANDPANLLAVDGDANQDKGAGDASQWLPPQAGFACVYVVRQLRVKAAYGLWLTPDEHAAAERVLRDCVVAR